MIARRRKALQRRDSRLASGERSAASRDLKPTINQRCCHPGLRSGTSIIDSKGFTLIELLVVISIIAVLMAILFPTLSRVRRQARAVVCQTKLRQWGMALNMYAQDNEGRFPAGGSAGAWLLRGTLLSASSTDPNAPQDSLHHFRTEEIACCPMATRSKPPDMLKFNVSDSLPAAFDLGPVTTNGIPGSEFPAWVIVQPAPPFVGSYGFNKSLFVGGFGPLGVELDVFSLKGKSSIPLLLDSVAPSGHFLGSPPPIERNASNFFCVNRHDGSVNGLFLDWSMRRVGLKELWTLKWSKDFDMNGRWTKAGGVTPEQWPKWMRRFKDY